MGLFGEKFNTFKSMAEEKIKDAHLDEKFDTVKQKVSETAQKVNDEVELRKSYKAPVEGALTRFEMAYIEGFPGNHPQSSDPKTVGLNILQDKFVIKPEYQTMHTWFGDTVIEIPYGNVKNLTTEKIGSGTAAEAECIVSISCSLEDGSEKTIKLQMLDGITYTGQEGRTKDLMNFLVDHNLFQQ